MAYNFPNSPATNDIFQDYKWDGEKWILAVGGIPPTAAETLAFLARTSGLDSTHINAYTALINGLVSDGVWSTLDVLQTYATQNDTTARLNLVSASYAATPVSTTFTANRGYSGGSVFQFVMSGFNPSTAVTPKFVRDSGHVSLWEVTNFAIADYLLMGANDASGTNTVGMHARYSDGNFYGYLNAATNNPAAVATSVGHSLFNRSASNAVQGYKNGASVVTGTTASTGLVAREIVVLGQNDNGTVLGCSNAPHQVAMISIGSSLNSTLALAFYNRLRTYMTAVGVP